MKGTSSAGLQLAIPTLEDKPVGSRMTNSAVPEDKCVVGLDHGEGMMAVTWYRHFERERNVFNDFAFL